jgi:quinol-cytochrome oxidoreductase complex cytochrome b subunit
MRTLSWDIVGWLIGLMVLTLYFVGYALPYHLS